jgi:hypothetical protein
VRIDEQHVQLLSEFIIRASLGWRSLLAGDPSDHIQTHDGSMESTYERCYANKPYSKANTQSLQSQFQEQTLYCVCRSPEDGRTMLGCDHCDEWYHFSCVGLNSALIPDLDNFPYSCPKCVKKERRKKTIAATKAKAMINQIP